MGQEGLDFFMENISQLKQEYDVDFTIVNGENSDKSGVGITRSGAETLLSAADVVTTGNHSHRRCDETLFLENERVLHPANQPFTQLETGCFVGDMGRLGAVRVINIAGVAWMEPLDNPYARMDQLLADRSARFTIVDVHGESTAEKKALAYYLDGHVSAVFGTHTHVQTADEQILPKGTGYITDVGMTGPANSVIGVEPQLAVTKQREHIPVRFTVASGPCMLNGAVFTLCEESGLCTGVERVLLQHR